MELIDNALEVLRSRYLRGSEKTWGDVCDRLTREMQKIDNDNDFIDNCKNALLNMDFLPGGRIIRNIGTIKGSAMNCNAFSIGDSIEEIGECCRDALITWSGGGGIGVRFSTLRPKGTKLTTKGGVSSGLVSFLKAMDSLASTIETGGQRRAAGMAICDVSHPEIFDFINSKLEDGLISFFNISVAVNNQFLEAVEKDGKWDLVFNGKVYNTVNARDLWNKILTNMVNKAEPGLINWDNLVKNNTYSFSPIDCTNPCAELPLPVNGSCLSKNTKIFTKDGIRNIDNFKYNDIFSDCSNFEKYSNVKEVRYMGKRKISRITLENDLSLDATEDHRIFTNNGYKTINNININDMVKIQNDIPIMPFELKEIVYEVIGWMHGDGWFTNNSIGISFSSKDGDFDLKEKYLSIYHELFGERKPIKDNEYSYQEQTDKISAFEIAKKFGFNLALAENRSLPSLFYEWSLDKQLSLLRGLFGADGGVCGKANSQIALYSRSETLIDDVQKILASLGIHGRQYIARHKGNRKDQYKLIITKESAIKFMKIIGFSHPSKINKFNWNAPKFKDDRYYKVISKVEMGIDDVYDIDVPETRCFFANGMLVHNCCLGAINLKNMLHGTQTDWKKLENTIKTGVRMLDNVIDLNYYPVDKLAVESIRSRRIGLGVMGLADMLLAKKIRYGSEKCLSEVEKLFKFIRDKAYEASIELAKIKSPFPMFNKIDYGKASFIRKLPAKIRMMIKDNGIRNSTLLTCAPTGTTSLLANVSSGIEPIPFLAYMRHDRISDRIYIHPEYKRCIESDDVNDALVDSTDLKPEDHLEVQATIQKYIDSSISKTINLPSNYTADKLDKLLLEYIYDLKGVTVYRDGCRDGQVLNRITLEEAKKYIKSKKTDNNLQEQDVACTSGKCTL